MKKIKTILILVCLASMVLGLSACGSINSGPIDWPDTGLATLLPDPPEHKGEIKYNDDDYFSATIRRASDRDFEEYVEACIDHGFTVEANKGSDIYEAFNTDGYKLGICFYPNSRFYSISLNAPFIEEGQTFIWPTTGPAALLPEPSSNVGRIQTDSSMEFSVYVGEFSPEEYESYVDECIKAGFDVDYTWTDTYFRAKNAGGDKLYIDYIGLDIFYISIVLAWEEPE